MATETLERRFAAIGARVKVVKRPPRSWELIDVETDRRGEYFELRLLGQRWISATVVDEDRDERCLLLLLRESGERSKFLCGLDERHWLVAAEPESVPTSGRWRRRSSLQPGLVRDAADRKRPRTGSRGGTSPTPDRARCPSRAHVRCGTSPSSTDQAPRQ